MRKGLKSCKYLQGKNEERLKILHILPVFAGRVSLFLNTPRRGGRGVAGHEWPGLKSREIFRLRKRDFFQDRLLMFSGFLHSKEFWFTGSKPQTEPGESVGKQTFSGMTLYQAAFSSSGFRSFTRGEKVS